MVYFMAKFTSDGNAPPQRAVSRRDCMVDQSDQTKPCTSLNQKASSDWST